MLVITNCCALFFIYQGCTNLVRQVIIIIIIIIIIIYLTANGLSSGGSGYNACT